jgi:hypothetical protein
MTATTIIDIKLITMIEETPIMVPSRGLSITNNCEREFAIVDVWSESVDTYVVMAVEVMAD